jgi:hypothetical protein
MQLEYDRLQADIAELEARITHSKRGPGLRARSVRSFLSQLSRHKREMLRDLDLRLAESGVAFN